MLLVVIGMIAFDVSIEPRLIPAAVVAVLLGGLCLSSLGLAVVSFVRKAESAPLVSNITMFPLIFLSGVFFPIGQAPQWVQDVANVFPIAHLVDAFTGCFDPATTGSGFTSDYWSLVWWTAIGLFVAVRRFRVEMTAAGGDRAPSRERLALRRGDHRGGEADRLVALQASEPDQRPSRCRTRGRGRSPPAPAAGGGRAARRPASSVSAAASKYASRSRRRSESAGTEGRSRSSRSTIVSVRSYQP